MTFSTNIRAIIFLGFVLMLAGCPTLDKAPITKIFVIDTVHGVCSERIITDKRTLASRWKADHPIEYCDGNAGLAPEEFAKLRVYLKNNK